MIFDAATIGILWPAFIAGLLVTATHVPLGMQVLARGIVFIDLAVAQVAGLGVILAHYLGWEPTGPACRSPPSPPRSRAPCFSRGRSGAGPRSRKRSSEWCSCSGRARPYSFLRAILTAGRT